MAGKKSRTTRNRVIRSAVLSLSLLSFIPVFGVIRQDASTGTSETNSSDVVAEVTRSLLTAHIK